MFRIYFKNELVEKMDDIKILVGALFLKGYGISFNFDEIEGYYATLDQDLLIESSKADLSIIRFIGPNIRKITLKETILPLILHYPYRPGKYLCGTVKIVITYTKSLDEYEVFIEAGSLEEFIATLSAFRAGELVREGSEISESDSMTLCVSQRFILKKN